MKIIDSDKYEDSATEWQLKKGNPADKCILNRRINLKIRYDI